MPEGPLIIIFKDELSQLIGQQIEAADTKLKTVQLSELVACTITSVSTWGKYLFFIFDSGALYLRIHWGMFGVYYLNKERPNKVPTATFSFTSGRVLYLYSVSLRIGEGLPATKEYDPRADVMNKAWDTKLAIKKLNALPPETMICDALMDQTTFAGLGNVIKTEALFAQRIHPESLVSELPLKLLKELVDEAIGQSQLFLEGKRSYGNERYGWVVIYRKKVCPQCGAKMITAPTGMLQRKSHWCERCQKLYA